MKVWNVSIGQEQSNELLHILLESGLLNNFQIEMELGDMLHWKLIQMSMFSNVTLVSEFSGNFSQKAEQNLFSRNSEASDKMLYLVFYAVS